MLSVIIPVYNRHDNLLLCLAALDRQDFRDLEVIVADDGSTDDPLAVLTDRPWHFSHLYARQPHLGVRIGQARNMGRRLARGAALVFIDSDVLLNPTALGHYAKLHAANPTAIIAGRYDWLSPMVVTMEDVQHRWQSVVAQELTALPIKKPRPGLEGNDPRAGPPSLFDSSRVVFDGYCLSVYSGNMLWPVALFDALGGFSEEMIGHGGEDCELAMRAQESHYPVIFSEEVGGYHVWHPRNQEANVAEVLRNIEYIKSKHDLAALGISQGDPAKNQLPLIGDAENEEG